jgi:phospholipid/cholesterol/gamma-HCH transport system ATP-binding protein
MIRIQNLEKSFGPKRVFTDVSLSVKPKETHVVVGRSGEGKSVLLKHVCGLLQSDRGQIAINGLILGEDPKALEYVRHKISMVFQMAALFDSLSVYENVAFFYLENGGKTKRELDYMVAETLDLVDLPNTQKLHPSELSGGMRKRVGLARALASDPEIILYDEPTTGLDPVTSEVINQLMVRVKDQKQVTSMIITHDMRSAYAVGDLISMLYEGEIIFTGTPDEIKASEDPVVNQFVNGLAVGPITAEEEELVQTRASRLIDSRKINLD